MPEPTDTPREPDYVCREPGCKLHSNPSHYVDEHSTVLNLYAIDRLLALPHRDDDEPCSCDECMAYGAEDSGADWTRLPVANRIAIRILDGADDRHAVLRQAFRDHDAASTPPPVNGPDAVRSIAATKEPTDTPYADPWTLIHDNGFTWDDVNALAAILGRHGLEIVARPTPALTKPTMTHEPHCNDRCIHYLAGESVSGVAPDVPHREPVGRNSPSQGGVTDSPAPEPIGDTLTYVIGERDGKLTPVLYRQEPLYAPEPGADAALRLYGFVNISYSDTDPGDMGEPRVFQSDGEWYVTVPSWAALARPTPALDVEALDIRWLLDNSNPMHYQGCEPDGCSCGVSAKYEAIIDRQAVREERAARATEGGTDR